MNVVCCVGRVEIQIEIVTKDSCTANTDSKVNSLTFRLSSVGEVLRQRECPKR